MKTPVKFVQTTLFALAIFCGSSSANATPLFSNLSSSSPGFVYNAGFNVQFVCGFGPCSDVDMAMAFTPTSNAIFTSLDLPFALLNGSSSTANALDVYLLADLGGMPGAVIESFRLIDQLQDEPDIVTAISVLNPLLAGGARYWIATSTPFNRAFGFWNLNSTGDTVGGTATIAIKQNGGGWTDGGGVGGWGAGSGQTRAAFQVNGTLQVVPESSTLSLLAFGLLTALGVSQCRHGAPVVEGKKA